MAATIFDTAMERLGAAYDAEGGDAPIVAADPAPKGAGWITIVTTILDIAKTVLAQCPQTPTGIKAAADAPTAAHQFVVRRAVRQELRDRFGVGGYAEHDGDRIVRTIIRAGKEATADDIAQLARA